LPIPILSTARSPTASKKELVCCVLPAVVAALVSAVVKPKLSTYSPRFAQSLDAGAVRTTLHVTASWLVVPSIPMETISRSCTLTPLLVRTARRMADISPVSCAASGSSTTCEPAKYVSFSANSPRESSCALGENGGGGGDGSGGGDGMAGESSERSSSNIWTRSALDTTTVRNTIVGGQYGGGGGGSGTTRGGGPGGTGAVKLVYKTSGSATLEFPSTNVGEIPTAGTTTTQVSNPIPVFVENPSHTYSRAETINSNFDKITFDTKLYKNYGSSYSINNLDPILTNNGVDDEFITQKFPSLRFDIKNTNFPVIGNSELPKQQFSKISFDTKLSKIYGSNYNTNNLNEISIKNGVDDEFITQKFPPLRFDIKNTVFDGPTSKTKIPTTQTTILTGFDKSSNSPTFCNSLQFNFRIKMGPIAEWGHFTKDGVGSFSILNRYNDPRLTSASSSSSSSSSEGDSESSGSGGTGPVQSWSS